MDKSLRELKEVHKECVIFILHNDVVKIYDEDEIIVEYLSNIIGKYKVINFKFKYIDKITNLLKNNNINYVILDSNYSYKIYDYYYTQLNQYMKFVKKSSKYNKFRRIFIMFYNTIFGVPFNRFNI